MKLPNIFILLPLLAVSQFVLGKPNKLTTNEELSKFLAEVNENLAELYNKEVIANWHNELKGPHDIVALLQSEIATDEIIRYMKKIWPKVLKFKRLNITDGDLRRQLGQIPKIGYEVLDREDLQSMYAITERMSETYRYVNLCEFENRELCNLTLVPDIQKRLHASENIEEIDYYWLEWRRKTGTAARADFLRFAELYKKTAKLNGYLKPSDFWFKDLEENSNEAMSLLDEILRKLRPMFLQFHAYVRHTLRKTYGLEKVPINKPYVQNLAEIFIGNAFQSSQSAKYSSLPYPHVKMPNVTKSLLERGLNNAQRTFWNVADYYRSIGMSTFENNFWTENAKLKADLDEKYTTCWAKAWKYYGLHQQSLSYCTDVNDERFFNMFEVVNELNYYRAYEKQPTLYQEEPFPGFSDALGKVFSLAASSPRYLEKLKLIEAGAFTSKEARINRLYIQGLRTIFLIPVFYVLDHYRVGVLDGNLNITDNCAYWQLTAKYTGAEPPVLRSSQDFDAPAKLLIDVDDQYTSQIMSIVLQFQLYKHFCELTGQYEKDNPELPLDLCDLSNQRTIGPLMNNAMSFGASKSYKSILKLMTNETELQLDGLLAYFEPLYHWLLIENAKSNTEIGWEATEKCI